ncbi:MAG: ParA family protein [SAR324 cluster bacterium]|nr:ParA family protein [SAR324 cluster bacterium]
MTCVISFVSQKGGVGKTTSAVNLSVAFALAGHKVLLLDLDPQSSVRYSFGIEEVKFGSKDWILSNNSKIADLVINTKEHPKLDFLVSNINNLTDEKQINRRLAAYDYINNLLLDSKLDYDYAIIDAPSSTSNLAVNSLVAADLIVMPLQCENLAIKSLKRFLSSFHELQGMISFKELRLAGILLTRFDRKSEVHQRIAQQLYHSLSDAVFQSIIPDNEEIIEASALGQSVITYRLSSTAATAYIRLMRELKAKFALTES